MKKEVFEKMNEMEELTLDAERISGIIFVLYDSMMHGTFSNESPEYKWAIDALQNLTEDFRKKFIQVFQDLFESLEEGV